MEYRGRPPEGPGPAKEEWKKVEGLYSIIICGTEPVFCAVSVESDGYLHVRWEEDDCLYQHESVPTVFFRFDGCPVVFEGGRLYYDNIKGDRIDDPVTFMRELLTNNPERHDFSEWVVDDIVNNLKYLGRHEEAERIVHLQRETQSA